MVLQVLKNSIWPDDVLTATLHSLGMQERASTPKDDDFHLYSVSMQKKAV